MSEKESPTQAGQEKRALAINLMFETFSLAYRNWMFQKTDEEIQTAKRLWLSHLKNFDASVITQGAEQAIDRFKDHPPTLGQFKASLVVKPEHKMIPHLTIVQQTPEVAAREISKMREKVRLKKK